ncbi:hypothetical protein D3C85_13690 [compost metagenome]
MQYADYDSFDTVSLEHLEFIARNISMEAWNAPTFMVDARKRLSQFFTGASSYFSKLNIGTLATLRPLSSDLDGIIARFGFVDASNKSIIVPEGFIGQWVPYSEALKDGMNKAIKIENMVLKFNETIGRILHNPDILSGASGIGHAGPVAVGVTETAQMIGKVFFDGSTVHIHRQLGSVIERAQDIKVTKSNLNDMMSLDKSNPSTKVQAAIGRTMDLSGRLIPLVEERQNIAKNATQELVDITLSIAREVESYGVLLFRIRQFSEAVKDSVAELKKQ